MQKQPDNVRSAAPDPTGSGRGRGSHGIGRRLASWLAVTALAAPVALGQSGQDIYMSTGAHGEISFSDVAAPGAQRVVVDSGPAVADPLAETERRVEQTLSVANALEASRLARQRARAEARALAAQERAAAQPEVVYQDRYVSSPYLLRPDRRHHDRPRQPADPEPEPPAPLRRAFPAPD